MRRTKARDRERLRVVKLQRPRTPPRGEVKALAQDHGMAAASEQCTVCGTVILLTCNKYRLVKAPTKAAGAQDHTKVGQTLLNVTKSTAVLQLIREGKLVSNCCCKGCYKFIMNVDKAEQQLFLLRSELESKIKNTCIRYRHTAQNVPLHVQVQSMVGAPRKRVPQSPLPKTGITPPSKRPPPPSSSTRRPLQPSTLQQSSSSTSGTPPSSSTRRPLQQTTLQLAFSSTSGTSLSKPPPLTKRPLQPLAPKPSNPPLVVTPQLRRELFPKRSQVPTTSTAQKEIRIPVYTDLESDPDEDIKVSIHS